MKHLIIGGARSGKSGYAEREAKSTHKKRVYIATAEAGDEEMARRIAIHQQSRGDEWHLVEEPIQLADAIRAVDQDSNVIVVDCLTLWITNCLINHCFPEQKSALIQQLSQSKADIVLVSNEVGSGIIPLGELSRDFVDQSGWLNQKLGEMCDRVTLLVAGLPLKLKEPSNGQQ